MRPGCSGAGGKIPGATRTAPSSIGGLFVLIIPGVRRPKHVSGILGQRRITETAACGALPQRTAKVAVTIICSPCIMRCFDPVQVHWAACPRPTCQKGPRSPSGDRRISLGRLSGRMPFSAACRRPSRRRCRYSTSTTRVGLTQWGGGVVSSAKPGCPR